MKLSRFTLSDDLKEFEGYTDGSLWNGWANVCFTKEQVIEFMKTTPYDYCFYGEGQNLIIYWDDENEVIESSPLPTDDGDILEGYFLDSIEFMEVEK